MTNEEAINRLFMLRDELQRQIAICTDSVKLTAFCDTVRLYDKAIEALKERPHGEWFGTVCTNCGESTSFYYDCNYCPQCGADMGIKGGETE